MRPAALALLLPLLLCTCAPRPTAPAKPAPPPFSLTPALRRAHLDRRSDSTAWDREMLAADLVDRDWVTDVGPFPVGVYPVPDYDLVGEGSFRGLFSYGTAYQPDTVAGQTVVATAFGVARNPLNAARLGEADSEVFFTIVTTADSLNEEGGVPGTSLISSRNHPDYVGQGTFRTTTGTIAYAAFLTPENDRFALVNLRLFDLHYGNVIVVVRRADGSLRSLQIADGRHPREGYLDYLRQTVYRRADVMALLRQAGR